MENITDDKYISLICNGEFNAIPDFKIGELFESFFDNINYNVVKENEKDTIRCITQSPEAGLFVNEGTEITLSFESTGEEESTENSGNN